MRKYTTLIICIILLQLINSNSYGQKKKHTIIVVLLDSLKNSPLEFATVGIYKIGDSTAFHYALTNDKGKAELGAIESGNYKIKCEYIGYKEQSRDVKADGERIVNIGDILMSINPFAIDDVIVTGNPVTVKEDSIIFNAKYFNPASSDYLENLIAKMPGLEIKEGKIYYNGKPVSTLTVEGKPFFSSDQSVALQNLPAYAIKSVTVHKKKNQFGSYSGMESSVDEPLALDVTLKDEMKTGFIGNLMGGYGTEDKYRAKGFGGRFAKESQYAIIAEANNTSTSVAPSTSRATKTSPSFGVTPSMMGFSPLSSPGIIRTITGGADYSTLKSDSKLSNIFNTNATYRNTKSNVEEVTNRETYIPDGTLYNNKNQFQTSENSVFNLSAEELFSNSAHRFYVKFLPDISYNKQVENNSSSYYSDRKNQIVANNEGKSKSRNSNDNTSVSGVLEINKYSVKKDGRYITAIFNFTYQKNNFKSNNYSETKFTNTDTTFNTIIDQQAKGAGSAYSLLPEISVTDKYKIAKLNSQLFVKLFYKPRIERNISDKTAYNFNELTNKYDLVDSSSTGYIRNTFVEHNLGLNLSFRLPKRWNVNLGFEFLPSFISNEESDKKRNIESEWLYNYAPTFNMIKILGMNENIKLNYRGYTKQATIDQLQPIVNNTNPLFIRSGNMNLIPEFYNTIVFEYNTSVNRIRFSSNIIQNKIINKSSIDSLGVKRTSPVNENGAFSMQGSFYYYKSANNQKFRFQNKASCSFNRNIGYTNDQRYLSNTINASEGVTLSYYKNYFSANLGLNANYSNSWYTLESMDRKSQWTNSVKAYMNSPLPWKMNIITDFEYTFYLGYKYDNKPASIWNMEIAKQLFNNKCVLSIRVHDILNQTKNLKVIYGDDFTEELINNSVKQYFMVNFSCKFGKFGN